MGDENVLKFRTRVELTEKLETASSEIADRLARMALTCAEELYSREKCFQLTTAEYALQFLEAAKVRIEEFQNTSS